MTHTYHHSIFLHGAKILTKYSTCTRPKMINFPDISKVQQERQIKEDTFVAITCFEHVLQYLDGDDINTFHVFVRSCSSKVKQFVEDKADEAFHIVGQKYAHYASTLETLPEEQKEHYAETARPRTYGCDTDLIELIESLKSNIRQLSVTCKKQNLVNLIAYENLLAGPRQDVQFDIFRGEPINMNEFNTNSSSEAFTFYHGYDRSSGFATISKELALMNGDIIRAGTKHYISFQMKNIGEATSHYRWGAGIMRPVQNCTWDTVEDLVYRYEPRRRITEERFGRQLNIHRDDTWQGDRDLCLVYPNYLDRGQYYIKTKKWGDNNEDTDMVPSKIGLQVKPNENKIEECGLLCDMTKPEGGGTLTFFTNGEKVFEVKGKFTGEYVWVLQLHGRWENMMPLRIRAKKYFSQKSGSMVRS